ncbi:MAG: hypothetical protein EOO20_23465 [Chryseobacterium sp.]|nr:MAG: hypothetical protein EOO20_23465 [Chryseobacterium sp.]
MIRQLFFIITFLSVLNNCAAQPKPEDGVYPLKVIPTLPLKAMGLKIETSVIHNNSGSGLTTALVDFGGFTGSFISKNGLLVTTSNELILDAKPSSFQKTDSVNRYFFAGTSNDEIEAKGLTCTITDPYGNTLKLLDLRFVYCPLIQSAQNDNGSKDFIFLRAYVSPDGRPTTYSKDNVAYVPTKSLSINANGAGTDDFIFLLGFSKSKRYQTKDELLALKKQGIIDSWFSNLYETNTLLRISQKINKFRTMIEEQPVSKKDPYFNQHIDNVKQSLLSEYQKLQIDQERTKFISNLSAASSLNPGFNVDAVRKITDRSPDAAVAINEFVNEAYGFTKLKDQKYTVGVLLKSNKAILNYNDGLMTFEGELTKQLENDKKDRENTYQLGLQDSRLLFTFGKISTPPIAFSGSPVLNANGELVGVINNKLNMVDIRTIVGVTLGAINGQTVLTELGINN